MSTPEFVPPWFVRWLIGHGLRSEDEIPPPTGWSSWTAYLNAIGGGMATYHPLGGPPAEGAELSVIWQRDNEDVATLGIQFVHKNPDVDGDTLAWDGGVDSAVVEDAFDALWADIKDQFSPELLLAQYRWHHFGVGIRKPNPQFRDAFKAVPVAGTAGGDALPPQVACSVTKRTSQRRGWGRCYMPAATVDALKPDGHFSDAFVDAIRTAWGNLLDTVAGANLPMVVWSPRHDGKLLQFFKRDADHPQSAHELNLDEPDVSSFARSVDLVVVDDVADVIRSRRYQTVGHRASHTLP